MIMSAQAKWTLVLIFLPCSLLKPNIGALIMYPSGTVPLATTHTLLRVPALTSIV